MKLTNDGKQRLVVAGAFACALVLGIFAWRMVRAAPPDDAPPREQRGDEQRPPPPPPRLEETISEMNLSDEQCQKITALEADLHEKQQKDRDDFLNQVKEVVSADQFNKIRMAMDRRPPPGNPDEAATQPAGGDKTTAGTVIFTGGHETDPRDGGRPDVLIAAALNVPTDVFRKAFTGVTPATGGNAPEAGQVHLNKQALLKVLGPYGVTNDRLDEVSNYYRYMKSRGEIWRTSPASAVAIVTDGVVTGFTIIDAGSGYSSPPTITVVGFPAVTATAVVTYTTDFKTNGAMTAIKLTQPLAK